MASQNAVLNNSSFKTPSSTKEKLKCGTSRTMLSRYRDFEMGESGALSKVHVQKLRKHIHHCDQCRHYLAQLDRLHTQLAAMNKAHIADAEANTTWLDDILSALSLDINRGHLIAIPPLYREDTLGIYEGAVRAIARRVASSGPIVVASTHIVFIDSQTSALRVHLEAYASYPCDVMEQAELARQRVLDALAQQNNLDVREVNLEVIDIIVNEAN